MNDLKLAAITLVSLLLLLCIHKYGISNSLYSTLWYYDIIAHILGGISLALSSLFILKSPKYIVIITFVLGIVWELYEIYFGLTGHPVGSAEYIIDTVKDLIMDTLGALVVWFIIKRNESRNVIEE